MNPFGEPIQVGDRFGTMRGVVCVMAVVDNWWIMAGYRGEHPFCDSLSEFKARLIMDGSPEKYPDERLDKYKKK